MRETPKGLEFLVKYKNISYRHTEWVARADLEVEPRTRLRVKKFLENPPPVDPEEVSD